MRKLKYSLLLLLPLLATLGCQEEYKAPESATVAMAGRWWVQVYIDGNADGIPDPNNLILDYGDYGPHLYTTNTSANDADSVLVDDSHGWPSRFIAPVNVGGLTFTPSTILNIEDSYLGSGETVTIADGKILKGAATSKGGRPADSLYLLLEFSDDAGNRYIFSGHRDSGFPDDHY